MSKQGKYQEHQYEERVSILCCPKCMTVQMRERWLRYIKKQTVYGKIPRKNPKPVSVWCPVCKFVLSSIKQSK